MTLVLGLESTCDDTCASVVIDGVKVLSNVVSTQQEMHEKFRGVVPEMASRAHLERMLPVLQQALDRAGVSANDLDAVAVSNRPGLIGGVMVSVTTAKVLSWALNIPLVGINHIHAHLYTGFMEEPQCNMPAVALTASGGHTLLCLVRSSLEYEVLGSTIDDAGGEAFDKGANLLGLKGGGGKALDELALGGDPKAVKFPRPMLAEEGYRFSFAGLKTALLYYLHGPGNKPQDPYAEPDIAPDVLKDIAASYQEAICEVLVKKAFRACDEFGASSLFVTGGVAANSRLRTMTVEMAAKKRIKPVFPAMALCTDNAAMIAGLGYEFLSRDIHDELDLAAHARSEETG
ncbi:MAG: tRNA (adenosine(37)-N6)-threonylcarbamoyltransferase complex transferase subunit TsaD [Planctomycetota bacterium]|nr:tRNA (adenosine(37)-N6)-threonylcarbamoyltransferase complex transferase subunit TsaD [Planctomycetota bacterium]